MMSQLDAMRAQMERMRRDAPLNVYEVAHAVQQFLKCGMPDSEWLPWACQVAGLSDRHAQSLPAIGAWVEEVHELVAWMSAEGHETAFDYQRGRQLVIQLTSENEASPKLAIRVKRFHDTSAACNVVVLMQGPPRSVILAESPSREHDTRSLSSRVEAALTEAQAVLNSLHDVLGATLDSVAREAADRDLEGLDDNPDIL